MPASPPHSFAPPAPRTPQPDVVQALRAVQRFGEALRLLLADVFAPDTCTPGAWTPRCPSTGHAASVSALITRSVGAHDPDDPARPYAECVSTVHEGQAHWFNRVYVGMYAFDMDITGDQYGFAPIQMATAGALGYDDVRVRAWKDLPLETAVRAATLAERIGLTRALVMAPNGPPVFAAADVMTGFTAAQLIVLQAGGRPTDTLPPLTEEQTAWISPHLDQRSSMRTESGGSRTLQHA